MIASSVMIGDAPVVRWKQYKLATKHYIATGHDGYTSLPLGTVLVNDESGPRLRTLLLNLFRELSVLNGLRSTTHHLVVSAVSKLKSRAAARRSLVRGTSPHDNPSEYARAVEAEAAFVPSESTSPQPEFIAHTSSSTAPGVYGLAPHRCVCR